MGAKVRIGTRYELSLCRYRPVFLLIAVMSNPLRSTIRISSFSSIQMQSYSRGIETFRAMWLGANYSFGVSDGFVALRHVSLILWISANHEASCLLDVHGKGAALARSGSAQAAVLLVIAENAVPVLLARSQLVGSGCRMEFGTTFRAISFSTQYCIWQCEQSRSLL
jgi:hypothetical protein